MKLPLIWILVLILLPIKLFSQVNMLNASYSYHLKEALIPLSYNSRSLHYGKFGFGWCSVLDIELEIMPQSFVVKSCDLKIEYPTANKANKELFLKNNKYYWVRENEYSIFDKNGNVLELKNQQNHYKFIYQTNEDEKTDTLEEIQVQNVRIRVEWKDEHVMGLYSSKSIQTFVVHENNLEEFVIDTRTVFFKYDDLNNLEEIESSPLKEVITYNKTKDIVVKVKNKQNCIEKYKYGKKSSDVFWSEAEISCANGLPTHIRHTFYYEVDSQGIFQISKSQSEINGKNLFRNFIQKSIQGDNSEK